MCVFEIGGLFLDEGDIDQELAFRYAVEKINLDKTILPRSKLSAQIERVPSEDSFHASKRGKCFTSFNLCAFLFFISLKSRYMYETKKMPLNFLCDYQILVCHLLHMGVSSIFGPQSNSISSHVQSICDTMEIPHLEMRWDYRIRRENCLVNLYPHPSVLSRVIL